MVRFKFPSLKNIVLGFVAGFFALQIISLVLSALFPSIPLFRGGVALLVMLTAIAAISLFVLSIKLDELKKRETLVFVVIIFVMLLLAYWKLPEIFPQLFLISPEYSNTIKQTMGSIIGSFIG